MNRHKSLGVCILYVCLVSIIHIISVKMNFCLTQGGQSALEIKTY